MDNKCGREVLCVISVRHTSSEFLGGFIPRTLCCSYISSPSGSRRRNAKPFSSDQWSVGWKEKNKWYLHNKNHEYVSKELGRVGGSGKHVTYVLHDLNRVGCDLNRWKSLVLRDHLIGFLPMISIKSRLLNCCCIVGCVHRQRKELVRGIVHAEGRTTARFYRIDWQSYDSELLEISGLQ